MVNIVRNVLIMLRNLQQMVILLEVTLMIELRNTIQLQTISNRNNFIAEYKQFHPRNTNNFVAE